MASHKITSLSVMVLMCSISPLALRTASAQETQPGDACVAGETGFFRRAGDDTPGPTIDGQNFMFCDGANWISFLQYNDTNAAIMLSSPAAAPADAVFNNSNWSLWLDEASDEFELKGRKSDGTFISATVGTGGLWTDNTTYISDASSGTHLINTGQTLPAVLDDDGTRMFFYPDKEAFRGGEITGANDAWQEANIGTHSFAWGQNAEASGNHSVAMGFDSTASGQGSIALGAGTASGPYSFATGYGEASNRSVAMGIGIASGRYSFALGYGIASGSHGVAWGSGIASGNYSFSRGFGSAAGFASTVFGVGAATGRYSMSFGNGSIAGDGLFVGGDPLLGALNPTVGEISVAFGMQTSSQATDPKITGDRSAVFFFDQNVVDSNSTYDFTATDRLGLVGGQLQIGETQAQGAAAGCIRFEPTSNALEYSDDCTTYNAFNGVSLWTDNTTYISDASSGTHLINTGQTLPAVLDDNGTRMFFYPDKEAFRGGEITGGNDAWQEANIGTHSFVWGLNSEASGGWSVAMGDLTTASGSGSVAMGGNNTASGNYSVAIGYNNTASQYGSVAMGSGTSSTGLFSSVALGRYTTSSGRAGFAVNEYTTASGSRSAAFGYRTEASGVNSVALGRHAVAGSGTAGDGTGDLSIAVGLQSASQATYPVVTGDRTMALFFDGNTANANSTVDVTANDALIIYGGRVGIGMTATPSVELDVVGDIEYTGTIADVSDRRLKTDIKNLASGELQKILDLQGVSFKMKDDLEGPVEFGFIAQDVQLLYPDLVYERADGMFSMNYVGLIAPMVEAMEEQNDVIELQKSRINILEDRLKSLEEKFQNMTVHGLALSFLMLGF